MDSYAAVILAGGAGRRLGGVDKGRLVTGGRPLLEHVLGALPGAVEIVVSGPQMPVPATTAPVRFVREDPPLGGPVAGLFAGVDALTRPVDLVVVLAVDMPRLTAATVSRLCDEGRQGPGGVLVDAKGRRHLAAAVPPARLAAVRAEGTGHGWPWRRLVELLGLVPVLAEGDETHDVDTWADLTD